MVSYTNETKVKDIPQPSLELEVKELLKTAVFDFGSDMKKEVFDHSVKRLTYLISARYKGLMLGEVKYVFECMTELIKSKLSVQAIIQLFHKYIDDKIEKQRQEMEEKDISYARNYINCANNPVGSALIHKFQMVESGELKMEDWDTVSLKELAQKIQSGEVKHIYKPDKKLKHIWNT